MNVIYLQNLHLCVHLFCKKSASCNIFYPAEGYWRPLLAKNFFYHSKFYYISKLKDDCLGLNGIYKWSELNAGESCFNWSDTKLHRYRFSCSQRIWRQSPSLMIVSNWTRVIKMTLRTNKGMIQKWINFRGHLKNCRSRSFFSLSVQSFDLQRINCYPEPHALRSGFKTSDQVPRLRGNPPIFMPYGKI